MDLLVTKEELNLTSGSVRGPLFRLALPVVLATLLQTVYNLTDTFWVGQFDSTALAALTFSFPLVFLSLALGGGVSTTGRILVAQYEGAERRGDAGFVAGQSLVFAVAAAVAIAALGFVGVPPLLDAMGAGADVRPLALTYLRFVLAGLPLLFLATTFSALLQGYGDALTPLVVVLGSVLLNLVLDPVLVFGLGPAPQLGLTGAAIATLGARGLAAVAGVWLLLSGRVGPDVRTSHLRPDVEFFGRVVRLGVPASLETTAIAVSVSAMLFVVGRFPPAVVAGFGVGERVLSLMFLPAIGVASATTTMVGQNLGADRPERAQRAARLAVGYPLAALTVVGLVVLGAAPAIARAFTPDPAVVGHAAAFLAYTGPAFGVEAAARIYSGVFRGAGRTGVAFALTGVTFLPVRLGLAWVLLDPLGPTAVWLSYALSGAFGAGLGFVLARVVDWERLV